MGFSHLGFCVPQDKFEETISFYLAALSPLGYKEIMRPISTVVGLGIHYPEFFISGIPTEANQAPPPPIHVAFSANSRDLVHAFYTAALKAGGKCNGPPGVRPQYTRYYYGAFVLDPAGNNIEAVCMWPAWTHWRYWFGMGVFGRDGGGQKKAV